MEQQNKPLVVLIDTHNIMYRMFHTRPAMFAKDRQQRIETVTAVLSTVKSIINMTPIGKADRVIAVADSGKKNHRHLLSLEYKANREPMPEELASQTKVLYRALHAYGVPVLIKKDVEADDGLGMLAEYYVRKGCRVLIYTTDKDMLQLVNDDVWVFNPRQKKLLKRDDVIEKMGVAPEQVIDFLALKGDSTDGITGIDKVGDVKAAQLLNEYGSIEKLALNANEIKGKLGENVRAGLYRLFLNKQLTRIIKEPEHLTAKEVQYVDCHGYIPELCQSMKLEYGLALA
jgi:DNA polymerase-1